MYKYLGKLNPCVVQLDQLDTLQTIFKLTFENDFSGKITMI